jgi:16S rRNA processing protein RimM
VLAELHTDFPERFEERRKLWCLASDGSRRELTVEEHWFHKGGVVLKFVGVDSISDAERLTGCEVQIPREERAELEAGATYVNEIVGSDVWVNDGRRFLGRVKDVQFGAGEAPLLVVQLPVCATQNEVLVPFAQEYVKNFDAAGKRLDMQLPEGMLELEAPLSDEEKRRQKQEAEEARGSGEARKRK